MIGDDAFFEQWIRGRPARTVDVDAPSDGRCDGCGCPTNRRTLGKRTDEHGTWLGGTYRCGDCQDRIAAGLPLIEARYRRCCNPSCMNRYVTPPGRCRVCNAMNY